MFSNYEYYVDSKENKSVDLNSTSYTIVPSSSTRRWYFVIYTYDLKYCIFKYFLKWHRQELLPRLKMQLKGSPMMKSKIGLECLIIMWDNSSMNRTG